MSNNSSLHQLKQKYRSRYYGNRYQDLPELKPWDNAMSFVNNYLNVTASISDGEDCEKTNVISRSLSTHKTDHLRVPPHGEGAEDSSKCGVNDAPQTSQGGGRSVTKRDPSVIPNSLKKYEKQPDLTDDKLFSDEESDDEESHVVAKLIEKSLADDDLVNQSANPREILYSSDTSVVQEPPSPTSNIHAKKWLSFKDATFAVNDNVFTNIVSRRSEEITNNAQPPRQQESFNYNNNENPNRADITYDLQTKSIADGPNHEFVIEEESSCNLDAWVSPFKKKAASPLPARPKEDKRTPTPKKTNTAEASSSLQKKSETVKALQISSATDGRPSNEFVIEEESSCNLDAWVSPYKKKTASPLPARPKEDKRTPTPKKTNTAEASSSLQKKSETVKALQISSATDGRPSNEFVIEEESSCNLDAWVSPYKKKAASPLPARPKEDKRTPTPKKTNSIRASSSLQKKPENVKASLATGAAAERMVNTEKKATDTNTRKISFSNIFFKTATAGHIGNRLSSLASDAPTAPSAVSEEEFEIEDISDINISKLLTIPVKAKSAQTGRFSKKEKSVPVESHPNRTVNLEPSNASVPGPTGEREHSLQGAALLRLVGGGDHQGPSSPESALPRVVEGGEKEESFHPEDDLPVENADENNLHMENTNKDPIKQAQQPQQSSDRKKGEWSDEKIFGHLDGTFTIRSLKGKGTMAAKNKKKSKPLKEKQEENLVKEKKVKKTKAEKKTRKSDKKEISLKARKELESAKDCLSNDLETEEILETSAANCASRKRKHSGVVAKADVKKHAEASVRRPSRNKGSEIDCDDEQQAMTDACRLWKKRKAKMKNVRSPCPADHNKEESVFQSGPVVRQKVVRFAGPVKPLACDLDFPDVESGGEEGHASGEDNERIDSSGEQLAPLDCSMGPKRDLHVSEEHQKFLSRYSIVFDPDTKSDALVECIAQSEMNGFVGSESSTCWFSFNNSIFTTGKLIISPKKMTERRVLMSDIVIYYVEQGRVQLNLHKTERILKNGDFFFVPPGNGCTIRNLQDTEAVLVFSLLKMLPLST